MASIFLPHILLWSLTSLVAFLLVLLAWPKRKIPGGMFFLVFSLGILEWTIAGTVEALVKDQSTKILWSQIEYIGFGAITPCLLMFIKAYLGPERLKLKQVLPWFIIPVITLALVWTNSYHRLIWTSFTPGDAALNILVYHHGPWFYVNTAYLYIMVVYMMFLLVRGLFSKQKAFRWQMGILLFSTIFPIISGTMYVLGWEPVPGMDISAVGFVFTGFFITLAILRFQLLDLMPFARETLMERMRDGVLIIDDRNRIVDLNPAVEKFFQIKARKYIGKDVEELLPDMLAMHLQDGTLDESAYELVSADAKTYMEAYTVPMRNRSKEQTGTLVILRDITLRKAAEYKLQDSNLELKDKLTRIAVLQESLQSQAVRDPLTNLYNRRYLEETLNREIGRAQRSGLPLSVLMVDIDHFKTVNDQYGHRAGDQVLQALAQLMLKSSRREDIACRYGGEEFIIIFPGCSLECARQRADNWREQFSKMQFETSAGFASATLSIGIAGYPGHGETDADLIHAADLAMYTAKEHGRNQVYVQPLPEAGTPANGE